MEKFTLTVTLFFILTTMLLSQNAVSVTANRYNLTVQNNFGYSLKVKIKSGGRWKSKTLSSGERLYNKGYFSASKIKRRKIVCEYNQKTYNSDSRRLDKNLGYSRKRLLGIKERRNEDAFTVFLKKLAAHTASKIEVSSSEKGWRANGKKFIKGIGNATKFYYQGKEFTSNFNAQKYNTYSEFFSDVLTGDFEDPLIEKAKNAIRKKIGLSAKPENYVLNAFAYYLKQTEENVQNYQNGIRSAESEHEKQMRRIKSYKDDPMFSHNHTYNAYNIIAKPLNLKTKTPNFLLTIDPISYGNEINSMWKSPRDAVFNDENNDDDLEWADGLWNTTLGASFHFPIFREINFSDKVFSRIYGGASAYNTSYKLERGIRITNNFFSEIPANSESFSISEPIAFEHRRLAVSAIWRFYLGKVVFFDLEGGYARQSGNLNLRRSKLSEGYEWAQTSIKIVEDSDQPFYGARIGFGGKNKYKGLYFTVGTHVFKIDQTNQTEYIITKSSSDLPVNFGSEENYLFRINVGFSAMF